MKSYQKEKEYWKKMIISSNMELFQKESSYSIIDDGKLTVEHTEETISISIRNPNIMGQSRFTILKDTNEVIVEKNNYISLNELVKILTDIYNLNYSLQNP